MGSGPCAREATLKIEVDGLTTCSVDDSGEAVELNFVDPQGQPMSLRIPFGDAQAMTMTLPRLLTLALQRITGSPTARYVFPLGGWRIEDTREHGNVITTLSTEDGFEVSFGLPLAACTGLGWALKVEADDRTQEARAFEGLTKSLRPN